MNGNHWPGSCLPAAGNYTHVAKRSRDLIVLVHLVFTFMNASSYSSAVLHAQVCSMPDRAKTFSSHVNHKTDVKKTFGIVNDLQAKVFPATCQ